VALLEWRVKQRRKAFMGGATQARHPPPSPPHTPPPHTHTSEPRMAPARHTMQSEATTPADTSTVIMTSQRDR
jgi:hypothetical protein